VLLLQLEDLLVLVVLVVVVVVWPALAVDLAALLVLLALRQK